MPAGTVRLLQRRRYWLHFTCEKYHN